MREASSATLYDVGSFLRVRQTALAGAIHHCLVPTVMLGCYDPPSFLVRSLPIIWMIFETSRRIYEAENGPIVVHYSPSLSLGLALRGAGKLSSQSSLSQLAMSCFSCIPPPLHSFRHVRGLIVRNVPSLSSEKRMLA